MVFRCPQVPDAQGTGFICSVISLRSSYELPDPQEGKVTEFQDVKITSQIEGPQQAPA
jgi:hypothetical protein